MNYKLLFSVVLGAIFNTHSWLNQQSFSNSFSLNQTDAAVIITVDTLKKVEADDIAIVHKNNNVAVDIKGLGHTLKLNLEAFQGSLSVSLCSEKTATSADNKKSGDDIQNIQEYSSFHGASCMRQLISAAVNLEDISAEYKGTQLILSVPLAAPVKSKKIPVLVTPETTQPGDAQKNKKITSEVHDK